ncbi:helix-turn-helix domain-containing protein [Rhodobacteraceae bacterium]|nr:helix-turn-helix domain-containing protein [Paracoccaceae bacterium]
MARASLTGTRIRERRLAIGMKQTDLARAAGISAAYVNLIEHNRRRVSENRLGVIAQALQVEAEALSEGAEGALFDGLREAAAQATGAVAGLVEGERIEEFVGRFPGWARLLSERQIHITVLERRLESLAERLSEDPFILDNLHEVLSAVTSLRSTAAILVDEPQIDDAWRDRFLNTIAQETVRLSTTAEALVGYLDTQNGEELALSSPQEQFEAWLAVRGWHLPEMEVDDPAPPDALIADAAELASGAARDLAREYLRQRRLDIDALPYADICAAVAELGADPGAIAARFGIDLPAVFRRLAGLPSGVEGLPPLGLVVCDAAGAMIFRKPAPGFGLPRFGAGCPLWPLYEALSRPMQPLRRVVDMAGRVPQRFDTYAICNSKSSGMCFDAPAHIEAMMLILPARNSASSPARAVGETCRICPRANCAARRETSLLVTPD